MRLLGKEEIENIAIGAALLGTGGGGDPYIGKLMALQAIEEHGPIRLLSVDEVPDGASRSVSRRKYPDWTYDLSSLLW